MGALMYSMIVSADGYTVDDRGDFAWGTPTEELHAYVNDLTRSVGTYLYGRRMYETMVYWETADADPDQPPVVHDFARIWQAAEKIVYSSTLERPTSERTSIRRTFDPEQVRELKRTRDHDLTVDGPTLAAQALHAGLVDEISLIIAPIIVGGGTRFFPDQLRCDLTLLAARSFEGGTSVLRYAVQH